MQLADARRVVCRVFRAELRALPDRHHILRVGKIQAPGALMLFLDGQTVDVDGMVIIRDPDCMRPRSQVFSDLARRPLVPRCQRRKYSGGLEDTVKEHLC